MKLLTRLFLFLHFSLYSYVLDALITHTKVRTQLYLLSRQHQMNTQRLHAETSTESLDSKTVLVIGGSGRVGGSTIRALQKYGMEDTGFKLKLIVGGRSPKKFQEAKSRWNALTGQSFDDVEFRLVALEDQAMLCKAMEEVDLVIHTAGPFQQKSTPEVLKAAICSGVNYIDVCDDIHLAQQAKLLSDEAASAEVAAVISTGIWPGISSLMAAQCDAVFWEQKTSTKSVDFNFFTAGTGNAGPTILSATFLILAEKVLAYQNGQEVFYEPTSDMHSVDFGNPTGNRNVFRMNLIEAYTCRNILNIPNVSTFFGTAPDMWNYLLKGMSLIPKDILRDRKLMNKLALISEPIVRMVDLMIMQKMIVSFLKQKIVD